MGILKDALTDTARLMPFLAAIYFIVGALEYRFGHRMSHWIMRIGPLGPVAGALVGCIPQCGFSVMASTLYVKRLVSVGTLLAVFISTSDEAVPVLLSMPHKAGMVGALIFIKVAIAIVAGLAVDHFLKASFQHKHETGACKDEATCHAVPEHAGCCSHGLDGGRSKMKALFLHPMMHTIKISLFLLLLTLILNFSIAKIGEERLTSLLLHGTLFQPVLTSLIGLIPNCFASVLLADLYAKGAISFGSMVGGLCAGCGLGVLVLAKENKDIRDTLFIIGLLLSVSVLAGVVLQCVR